MDLGPVFKFIIFPENSIYIPRYNMDENNLKNIILKKNIYNKIAQFSSEFLFH